MKHASKAFFLAFFTLLTGSHTQAHSGRETCAIDPDSIVSDACASYDTIDGLASALSPQLIDVTQNSDFFSYYRLNLYNRECPYWDDSTASCGNIACAVNTVDEQDIPEIWRRSELSKLEGPKAKHPDRQKQKERSDQKPLQGDLGDDVDESCVVEYDDECDERDFCIPEDAGSPGKGDYVSLLDNPERFTGYAGDHAHSVWDSIYRENCFTKPSPALPVLSNPLAPRAKGGLTKDGSGPAHIPFMPDDSCMEKRVFHRLISGMHASISTHICHEYLNQTTGVWSPNLACYKERLHAHPDRVSNLYFNYALVSRAVAKLLPYLPSYTFCAGDPAEDAATKKKVLTLAKTAASAPSVFDEALMFRDPDMAELKEDFRSRFRNVSRIMDCVGCDKCRLWGKLQTNGYGTALKVLFEFSGESAPAHNSRPLKRTELVSLVNTMARLSRSMTALKEFRDTMHTDNVASRPGPTADTEKLTSQRTAQNIVRDQKTSGFASAQETDNERYLADSYEDGKQEEVDNDDYDDDDDDFEEEHEQIPDWDIAMNELRLIYRTVIFIFKQWFGLPGKVWGIIIYELNRLYNWYIGLYPEPPIQWTWNHLPRDEL